MSLYELVWSAAVCSITAAWLVPCNGTCCVHPTLAHAVMHAVVHAAALHAPRYMPLTQHVIHAVEVVHEGLHAALVHGVVSAVIHML